MKPQFIIIAILIIIKVIGVAGRANADSYLPVYACDRNNQFNFIAEYSNPTYRCGQTPKFRWI